MFSGSENPVVSYHTLRRVVGVLGMGLPIIGLYSAFLQDSALAALKPVFWLESLALWAFGVSWFVKGETLWKDVPAA